MGDRECITKQASVCFGVSFMLLTVILIIISFPPPTLGVEEWLVSAVMSMYIGAKTVVRTVYGNSKGFEAKVGMHQGSGLSPLLFVIVKEAISREFRVALPWELLYADDLAV